MASTNSSMVMSSDPTSLGSPAPIGGFTSGKFASACPPSSAGVIRVSLFAPSACLMSVPPHAAARSPRSSSRTRRPRVFPFRSSASMAMMFSPLFLFATANSALFSCTFLSGFDSTVPSRSFHDLLGLDVGYAATSPLHLVPIATRPLQAPLQECQVHELAVDALQLAPMLGLSCPQEAPVPLRATQVAGHRLPLLAAYEPRFHLLLQLLAYH